MTPVPVRGRVLPVTTGGAAAIFIGTVVNITREPIPPPPADNTGSSSSVRLASRPAGSPPLPAPKRIVRFQIRQPFTGLDTSQKEIEILTRLGGGDCGFAFDVGQDYVVYASKNSEGRLETSICTRTAPVAKAVVDLQYFQKMADAPLTSQLKVTTALPGRPGSDSAMILAQGESGLYRSLTNSAGDATFANLPAGEYAIHMEADGDLPDDPKIHLYAKGCAEVMLFRWLKITGHVMTKDGRPASRIEVEARSSEGREAAVTMTDANGGYQLQIDRPGQYYLGTNLNHSPTHDTPYPRWFYPGTVDRASAVVIAFSGKPEVRNFDFALPDKQSERTIEGVVFTAEGMPMPRARVAVYDSSNNVIAYGVAGQQGRFSLQVYGNVRYRLHAVWPGNKPDEAMSAVPADIEPGTDPLSFRMNLTQHGNSTMTNSKGPAPY